LGTAIGTALITAVTFGVLARADWDAAFTASFAVITGIVLIAMGIGIADMRRRTPEEPSRG